MKTQLIFAITAVVCVLSGSAPPSAQTADPITDPDVYAIYATLLSPQWKKVSKGPLVLQQETEVAPARICRGTTGFEKDADWLALDQDYKRQNSSVWTIQSLLKVDIPYRLIPRADILADDARLELEYPSTRSRRPESMEHAKVSAVGFNVARTKALVYVATRSKGGYQLLALRDGTWVNVAGGCGWIA